MITPNSAEWAGGTSHPVGPHIPVSTKYIASCLEKLRPTFRTRTYRSGERVVFMHIKDATWRDLYPGRHPHDSDPLSYSALNDYVRYVVPEAQFTSGGDGNGTWRMPSYVVHGSGIPRQKPDQRYRNLYRYYITINRDSGIIHHIEPTKGERDPYMCLASAFHSLGQLLRPGDWDFILVVKHRGTGTSVISTPVISLKPKSISTS